MLDPLNLQRVSESRAEEATCGLRPEPLPDQCRSVACFRLVPIVGRLDRHQYNLRAHMAIWFCSL